VFCQRLLEKEEEILFQINEKIRCVSHITNYFNDQNKNDILCLIFIDIFLTLTNIPLYENKNEIKITKIKSLLDKKSQ
jgi:hypothetical protein